MHSGHVTYGPRRACVTHEPVAIRQDMREAESLHDGDMGTHGTPPSKK